MTYNHVFRQRYVCEFSKPYVYDLSILMLLLIPWTWYLKKTMEMLLLWNVMQTMNFSMMYKYEMFLGYVLWWSELSQ